MARRESQAFAARTPFAVVAFEAAGFIVAAAACWVMEWLSPPFHLRQAIVLSAVVLALGAVTTYWTLRTFRRIRFLEGFFVICAGCKRVRMDGEWISIESFLAPTGDLRLSHGMCPHCAEEYFGEDYAPQRAAEHKGA